MLGEAIRRARKDAGLTKAELARRLKVDWTTVWKWEANLRVPNTAHLLRLLKELPSLKNYLGGDGDGEKREDR